MSSVNFAFTGLFWSLKCLFLWLNEILLHLWFGALLRLRSNWLRLGWLFLLSLLRLLMYRRCLSSCCFGLLLVFSLMCIVSLYMDLIDMLLRNVLLAFCLVNNELLFQLNRLLIRLFMLNSCLMFWLWMGLVMLLLSMMIFFRFRSLLYVVGFVLCFIFFWFIGKTSVRVF